MNYLVRAQYHAKRKSDAPKEELQATITQWENILQNLKEQNRIFTASLFAYEEHLFLYVEWLEKECPTNIDSLLKDTYNLLLPWPDFFENHNWAYMRPVFWTGQPSSVKDWTRQPKPTKHCGRIAILYPDKIHSYVIYHQALVKEGLLVGDKYQFISILDNVLFSYFEFPRDLERCNLSGGTSPSCVLEEWNVVDPDSHFMRFAKDQRENFQIIDTLFTVSVDN